MCGASPGLGASPLGISPELRYKGLFRHVSRIYLIFSKAGFLALFHYIFPGVGGVLSFRIFALHFFMQMY